MKFLHTIKDPLEKLEFLVGSKIIDIKTGRSAIGSELIILVLEDNREVKLKR
jgi:hypothetical protein